MYTLKLQDKEYKVSGFNYTVFRELGRVWKKKNISEVEDKLQKVFIGVDNNNFEAIDEFGMIIKTLIKVDNPDFDIPATVVINETMFNPEFRDSVEYVMKDSFAQMQKKNSQQPPAKSQKHQKK